MKRKQNQFPPEENNGIVRIDRGDWARMKVIAEDFNLSGTQEVFEAVTKIIGYREGMPIDQIILAVKMAKLKGK
jgi:hypothetical protein